MPKLSRWVMHRVALALVLLGGAVVVSVIRPGGINEDARYLLAPAFWIAAAAILIVVVRQRARIANPAKLGLGLVVLYLMIILLGLTVTLTELSLGRQ